MEVLTLTNDIERKCPRCGQYRPITSFYRLGEDNYQSYCIPCGREYKKTRRAEAVINKLGFQDVPLGQVAKMAKGLGQKERTDLRNSLKYITSKIK